jgi:membrane protein DedA with SNARE-associated domain/pimeloyl-ACP methyl ester carboxylesterase
LIAIYIILLALSQNIRHVFPRQPISAEDRKSVTLALDATSNPAPASVRVSYRQYGGQPDGHHPIVLLIDGNPWTNTAGTRAVASELAASKRVIVPDLPGFGDASRSIDDYSALGHAEILLQMVDRMQIPALHLVAFGMGGSIALNMVHLAPERIRSVSMVSAVGVQEFELLGHHGLNRALYGFQLAGLWLLYNGLPHMGALDALSAKLSYARHLYATDLRPLRNYLSSYSAPMLILHGDRNALATASAEEHHRLVPQSQILGLNGDAAENRDRVATEITEFIARVEKGQAKTRLLADASRIAAARKPLSEVAVSPLEGPALAVLMILIILATLISEDLTCIGAGLLAARGIIGFVPALAAAFIGILFGDVLIYLAGRFFGRPALGYPPFKWLIKEEDLKRTSRWFAAKGPIIVFVSRFLPGSRFPTYFSAGAFDTAFWRFTFYFTIGSIIWTPLLVGLSMAVGTSLFEYFDVFKRYGIWVLFATVLLLWATVKLVVPLFSYRGRRLMLSSVRRITRWEFWPPHIFYLPVIGYVLLLMLRYRSISVFTAANPGIPEGGFIGESKSQILDGLTRHREKIARYHLIRAALDPDQRIDRALDFMSTSGCEFPVVLKPDVGQRGAGVVIARSRNQLEKTLGQISDDVILQEYIGGHEYGVFYYRYPEAPHGRIFSITDKRLLNLTGDGRSTLEELILAHDRAVCMAKFHQKNHADRLYDIPADGEKIRLVEVGTHCRGALFLDGNALHTSRLEAAIDDISRGFDGFYFGRYDIRSASPEDFARGQNFKIIELNGVTSEATHIYQPGNRLRQAYGVLMRQWHLAFEIGRQNVRKGAHPAPAGRLLKLLFQRRR